MFLEKLENNFSLEAPKNQESLKNQIDSNDMKEYDLQKIIYIIMKKEIDLSRPLDNIFVKNYERLLELRGNDLNGLDSVAFANRKIKNIRGVVDLKDTYKDKIMLTVKPDLTDLATLVEFRKNALKDVEEKIGVKNIDESLKKSIYDMISSGAFDSKVWDQFNAYNIKNGLNLRISDHSSDKDKMDILESVHQRFIYLTDSKKLIGIDYFSKKDEDLKVINKPHDKRKILIRKREMAFNNQLKNWGVSRDVEIKNARKELLNKYAWERSFEKVTYDNMAAFKVNKSGIETVTGKVDVMTPYGKDPFVEVYSSDLRKKVVSNLPDIYLKEVGKKIGESDLNIIRDLFSGKKINGKKLEFQVVMFKSGNQTQIQDSIGIRGLKLHKDTGYLGVVNATSNVFEDNFGVDDKNNVSLGNRKNIVLNRGNKEVSSKLSKGIN